MNDTFDADFARKILELRTEDEPPYIAALQDQLASAIDHIARLEAVGDQAVAVLTSLLVTHPQGDPIHRHVERVRDGLIAALEAQP